MSATLSKADHFSNGHLSTPKSILYIRFDHWICKWIKSIIDIRTCCIRSIPCTGSVRNWGINLCVKDLSLQNVKSSFCEQSFQHVAACIIDHVVSVRSIRSLTMCAYLWSATHSMAWWGLMHKPMCSVYYFLFLGILETQSGYSRFMTRSTVHVYTTTVQCVCLCSIWLKEREKYHII